MKRKLLNRESVKRAVLAVPAAALMLGAAQAGTTIGLNFQAWYYADGGAGYQTTGFPVTAKAFGVELSEWLSTVPQDCRNAINDQTNIGPVTISWTAPNAWQSGVGEINEGFVPQAVAPGDDEVTWGYLDDGNATGGAPTVSLSGLATAFPNGYVVQTIAANSGVATFDPIIITDGTTTNVAAYLVHYVTSAVGDVAIGSVGVSAQSGVFTANALNLYGTPKTSSGRSVLAGFIVTDKPVVTRKPVGSSVDQGSALTVSAGTIGVSPLSYQWRLNGTAIPNATNATYNVASAAASDAGDYDLVATNAYGATTSSVATVTVVQVPSILKDLAGATGTVYSGGTFSQWSVEASGGQPLDFNWFRNGTTRVGGNSATLALTGLTTADTGDYSVVVTNAYGSARSASNHLVVVASPNLYTTVVAEDAPAAYWPLNETSGENALDYSGNARLGTNVNGITLGAQGPRPSTYAGFHADKRAYQFDGTGYIAFGTGPSLSGTGDFTVEAWINTSSSAAGRIIQQRSPTGYNGEYMLGVNAGGTLGFTVYGGGYQFGFSTSARVNDGAWHHVVAVRSGYVGTIYIDGAAAATVTATRLAPLDATIQTYIGADTRSSGTDFSGFNGGICDVAIYAKALSASRIGLHAYKGRLASAPIVLSIVPGGYVADTHAGGVAHPGANNGVLWSNSVPDLVTPPVTRTGVAVFNGGSQIAVPPAADLDSARGTIMFWMQASAPIPGPGSDGAMLFDRRTSVGTVIVLDDAGAIFWQGQGNSFSTGYLPDGNWHHVAVTYGQASGDTISVYVDGQLSTAYTANNAWSWPTGQQIEIGASHDGYWKKFNGLMDDFRMYNRVLTDAEVAQTYAGALVDESALVLRYDFDTAGVGKSLAWPVGSLYSSPVLGPSAVWTAVPNAGSPYPFLPPPPAVSTNPAAFYRVSF